MGIEVIADGVVRDENPHWVYYIDAARVGELDPKRCGKWMYMTADLERADELVREAVVTGAVIAAKRSTAKRGNAALVAEERRMRGLRWCFENHGSPMDRGR